MRVIIADTDITKYINESSYNVNAESQYKAWEDGNAVEHRIHIRDKVKGSFQVALYGQDGMDTKAFLRNWNEGVKNNIATIMIYVTNLAENKIIEAHYSIECSSHRKLNDGRYLDILDIKLEEC